ncbi:GntR family transcriptional regulator [Peribacillus psychrosaccharolyticus]|uniref:GntR family transcriptional regulator n=1 Tax=Peribacillus psychrosaccharolyticus TaxID=1407 RepID=UPI003D2E5E97
MSEQTKYMRVKSEVKKWLIEGKVLPGEKIHSESQLVDIFKVSRHTIRQAIGELVNEGWLYRERGAGTFCAYRLDNEVTPVSKKGKMIGVITTYLSDYIFPSIIRGIESHLTEQGYSMIVASTNNDVELEKQCLEMMMVQNVDGLIIEPTKSSNYNPNLNYYLTLEQKNIPYVMINQFYRELNPPHIMVDDEKGGYLSTSHLLKLGHINIIGIFKVDDLQGMARMKGFIRAFREQGLSFLPHTLLTYTTENKKEVIRSEIQTILQSGERPTGIVCYNDEVAMDVLQILRKLEINVPADMSIVSHDNSYLSETSEIKLTSVTHPKAKLGEDAAKWIVSRIKSNHVSVQEIVYNPDLIIRTSTKKYNDVISPSKEE